MTIRLPDVAAPGPLPAPGEVAEAAALSRPQPADDALFVATALADLATRHGAALRRAEAEAFAGDAADGFAQRLDASFASDLDGMLSAAAAGARPSDDALEMLRGGAGDLRRALAGSAALSEDELRRFHRARAAMASLDGLAGLVAADPEALPQADAHLAQLAAAITPLFGDDAARRLHAGETARLAEAALRGLIAVDPDAALEHLSSGLFDGRLEKATRDRLGAQATQRRDALAADAARMQGRAAEAAAQATAAQAWTFARDFGRRIAAGEASEAELADAESAGLVSPSRAAALREALVQGEAQRAAEADMARSIGDLLDRGIAPDPSSSHARAAVDRHWRMVVEPAFDGQAAEDRIAGIGDYVSRTLILPQPALKLLVWALFDGEGDTRAAAAQALSAAAAADPASAALIAAPILDRARESAVLAQAGLPAGLAVQPLDEIAGDMRRSFAQPDEALDRRDRAVPDGSSAPTEAPSLRGSKLTMSDDELFAQYRENLLPREGGKSNRRTDRGGRTNQGVSQDLLDLLHRNKPAEWGHLPKDTFVLSDAQIRDILRKELFDLPKIIRLARIPGLHENAPRLAELVFDSGVTSGPAAAGRQLQQALDAVLGTDLRVPDKDGKLVHDGNVGPATRAAVERAVREGKIAEVHDRMIDERQAFFRAIVKNDNSQEEYLDGWLNRAESFRMH